ncbi:hypothetical protein ACFLW2_04855 [Chloroflexota bacterium]
MQTMKIKELESHEAMIQKLVDMRKEVLQAMQGETEAIDKTVSNIFMKLAHYLKNDEAEQTQGGIEQLESYENRMQELLTLKEEVIDAKMNEAKSIDDMLLRLATLCDHNVSPVSSIPYFDDLELILGQVKKEIAVHPN